MADVVTGGSGPFSELVLIIGRGLRAGVERSIPKQMMDLRAVSSRHPNGDFSIEIELVNRRGDARYRAQVTEAIGIDKSARRAPWSLPWQHAPTDEENHNIQRGGHGLLYVVVTRTNGTGVDKVPRFFEFPSVGGRSVTSWPDSIPPPEVGSSPAANFIDKRVRLRIRIWNQRLKRSQLWELAFWVTPELEIAKDLHRVRRKLRRPTRLDSGD